MAATLEYFVARKEAAKEAVDKLSAMLDDPSVRDLIVAVKTLELMEHYAQVDGYDALVEKMVDAARDVMVEDLTQDDMMYVARAIAFGTGIPLGSELRWQLLHKDSHNLNINADVIAGERTLESFGDVVLETFYAVEE